MKEVRKMGAGAVTEIEIPVLQKRSGKVREIFELSAELLLIVTTDRISAFDVVLPTGIPDKGKILNQLSVFWTNYLDEIIPNHLISSDDQTCLAYLGPLPSEVAEELKGRIMVVKRAEVIPVECVVRGYISGSLWKEYENQRGEKGPKPYQIPVYGHLLPGNLVESEELPFPIFTPTTKSATGHDINLTYEEMVNHLTLWLAEHPQIKRLIDTDFLAQDLRAMSLELYYTAQEYAKRQGIIIADTKFEFGFVEGKLTLIDEVLTPDSSRFWPADSYEPGRPQDNFDKQYVRDWLDKEACWDHEPPVPELPEDVVERTRGRYINIYLRLVPKRIP